MNTLRCGNGLHKQYVFKVRVFTGYITLYGLWQIFICCCLQNSCKTHHGFQPSCKVPLLYLLHLLKLNNNKKKTFWEQIMQFCKQCLIQVYMLTCFQIAFLFLPRSQPHPIKGKYAVLQSVYKHLQYSKTIQAFVPKLSYKSVQNHSMRIITSLQCREYIIAPLSPWHKYVNHA